MPPTPDNSRGYWESSVLMKLNDKILESGGSRWDDWESFNGSWVETPTGRELLAQIPQVLNAEFGDAPLFLVKDPRICRLLPVWLQALKEMRIALKVVLPFRHPAEVVRSLAKRDGITQGQAQLIWLRHVLDAEADSRRLQRVFVHYPDLIEDWRSQVERMAALLDIEWPRWSGAVQAEIEAYLSSELRHHRVDEESLPESTRIQSWVARAYRCLLQMTRNGEAEEAQSDLDAIRAEAEPLMLAYAPLARELQSDFDRRMEAISMEAAQVSQRHDQLASKLELSRQECLANYNLAMDFKAKMEDARNQYQDRENQHAVLWNRLESAQEKAAEISAVHSEELESLRETHAVRLADLGEKLHAQIRLLNEEKQRVEEVAQERTSEIVLLSRQVLELQALKSETEEAFRELRDRHDAQGEQLKTLAAERARLSKEVGARVATELALRREMVELSAMLGERHGMLEKLQRSLAWRVARRLPGAPRVPERHEVGLELEPAAHLARSGLFDPKWYLQKYPDVLRRRMNPVHHYLKYGAKERRDPGPAFSTGGYVARYPDVELAGMNPLLHYLLHGRLEGRLIAPIDAITDARNGT